MGFFRSGGKFLGAKSQQASANASKETNNAIARDPNVPADARLRAGFRGIGDRFKANKHGRSADAHKHAAKHNY